MTKLCALCSENLSKYCCPRCEVLYCSLACYKSEKHLECSENFYKKCVEDELSWNQAAPESKAKMLEILRRMHNKENSTEEYISSEDGIDSDDNEHEDLEERLKNINLDSADQIWEVLNEDEKNEFRALISSNDVGSIIPNWEPWWTFKIEACPVQDEEKEDELLKNIMEKCPHIVFVPPFKSLSSVKPSKVIGHNITNVLASYALVMRYTNGDADPVESASYVLDVCTNLASNANFSEDGMAVESVAQKCIQSTYIQTDEIGIDTMKKDTLMIQQGPCDRKRLYYCEAALSHIHKIFTEAKKQNIDEKAQEKGEFSKSFRENYQQLPELDRAILKKCIKKIEYYLAYLYYFKGDT